MSGRSWEVAGEQRHVDTLSNYKVGWILDVGARVTREVKEVREAVDEFVGRWTRRRESNPDLPAEAPWPEVAMEVVPKVIGPLKGEAFDLIALALADNSTLLRCDDIEAQVRADEHDELPAPPARTADEYVKSESRRLRHVLGPVQTVQVLQEAIREWSREWEAGNGQETVQGLLDEVNRLLGSLTATPSEESTTSSMPSNEVEDGPSESRTVSPESTDGPSSEYDTASLPVEPAVSRG